jgi:hypothetical protein
MEVLNNKKIYIICENSIYKYMEDYILSFKNLYMEIILFIEIKDIPSITYSNVYIFIQFIPNKILESIDSTYNNIYILNTEQLSRPVRNDFINSFPKNIKMIDYSKANMKYYSGYYTMVLPYQINYEEIYNFSKERDICIISASESPRRQNIIDEFINKGYNIDIISGWKKERDDKLFTYKILVNIGYDSSFKIFESLRCDRCIFNKMIVISEKKEHMDLYHLKDYMIFDDYENIVNKSIDVLNNYDIFYNKLHLDVLKLETLPIERIMPDWFI